MDNTEIVEIETIAGTETHVIIDRGNGEYTSMPKSVYDAQVEHLTSPLTDPTA